MCPFVEKKEKSVVFSLTYHISTKKLIRNYIIFSTPSNPPIINNCYNVHPSPPPHIIPIIPTPPIIRDSRVPACFAALTFSF